MDSCKFTPFGLCVKMELLRRGKSQKWLEEEVTRKSGMFVDSGYMYKILTGRRNAPKITKIIREILEPLDTDQDSAQAQLATDIGGERNERFIDLP